MSWSKEWPKDDKLFKENYEQSWVRIDFGSEPSKTVTGVFVDGKLEKVYNNKVPTHDPYTNPNVQIYYQCSCGDILDPGTKSFAALNNAAMNAGWKVRWGSEYYTPYCVKCGEGVE